MRRNSEENKLKEKRKEERNRDRKVIKTKELNESYREEMNDDRMQSRKKEERWRNGRKKGITDYRNVTKRR